MLRSLTLLSAIWLFARCLSPTFGLAAGRKPTAPDLAVLVLVRDGELFPCTEPEPFYGDMIARCWADLVDLRDLRSYEMPPSDRQVRQIQQLHTAVWEAVARDWRAGAKDPAHPASSFPALPSDALNLGALEAPQELHSLLIRDGFVQLAGAEARGGLFHLQPLEATDESSSAFLTHHLPYDPQALNDLGKRRLSATVEASRDRWDETDDSSSYARAVSGLELNGHDQWLVPSSPPLPDERSAEVPDMATDAQSRLVANILYPVLLHGRPDLSPWQAQLLASLALMSCPPDHGGCGPVRFSTANQLNEHVAELQYALDLLHRVESCVSQLGPATCSGLTRSLREMSAGELQSCLRQEDTCPTEVRDPRGSAGGRRTGPAEVAETERWIRGQRHVVETIESQVKVPIVHSQLPDLVLEGFIERLMAASPPSPAELDRLDAILYEALWFMLRPDAEPLRRFDREGIAGWATENATPGDQARLFRAVQWVVARELSPHDLYGDSLARAHLFTAHLLEKLGSSLDAHQEAGLSPRDAEQLAAATWSEVVRAHGGYSRTLGRGATVEGGALEVCGGEGTSLRPVHLDLFLSGPDRPDRPDLALRLLDQAPWVSVDGLSPARVEVTPLTLLADGARLYRLRWTLWSGWHIFYRRERDPNGPPQEVQEILRPWAAPVCQDTVFFGGVGRLVSFNGLVPLGVNVSRSPDRDAMRDRDYEARTRAIEELQAIAWSQLERRAAERGGLLVEILVMNLPDETRPLDPHLRLSGPGPDRSVARLVYLDGKGNQLDLLPRPESELAGSSGRASLGLGVSSGLSGAWDRRASTGIAGLELGLTPVLWGGVRRWGLEAGAWAGLGSAPSAFDELSPWVGASVGVALSHRPRPSVPYDLQYLQTPEEDALRRRQVSGARLMLQREVAVDERSLAGELWHTWSLPRHRGPAATLDPWLAPHAIGAFLRIAEPLGAEASRDGQVILGLRYNAQVR